MEGEMTIDTKQQRLAALNGHLVEDVKFGGGLLGHLDKGGRFEVRQTEVAPGHWEMTALNVDMKGGKPSCSRQSASKRPKTTATSIECRMT
jgi:hypothetical protein